MAKKYARNRKQELELQRELQLIKNKVSVSSTTPKLPPIAVSTTSRNPELTRRTSTTDIEPAPLAGLQRKGSSRDAEHAGTLRVKRSDMGPGVVPLQRQKFAIASTVSTTTSVKLQIREKPKRPSSVLRSGPVEPPPTKVQGCGDLEQNISRLGSERCSTTTADSRAFGERSGEEARRGGLKLEVNMAFGSGGEEEGEGEEDSPERVVVWSPLQKEEEEKEEGIFPSLREGRGLKLDDAKLALEHKRADSLRSLEFGERGSDMGSLQDGMEWGSDLGGGMEQGSIHSGMQSSCDVPQNQTQQKSRSPVEDHMSETESAPKMGTGSVGSAGGGGGSGSEEVEGPEQKGQEDSGATAVEMTATCPLDPASPKEVVHDSTPLEEDFVTQDTPVLVQLGITGGKDHPYDDGSKDHPHDDGSKDHPYDDGQSDSESSSDSSVESSDPWPKSCFLSHAWPLPPSQSHGDQPVPSQQPGAMGMVTLLSPDATEVAYKNVVVVSKDVSTVSKDVQDCPGSAFSLQDSGGTEQTGALIDGWRGRVSAGEKRPHPQVQIVGWQGNHEVEPKDRTVKDERVVDSSPLEGDLQLQDGSLQGDLQLQDGSKQGDLQLQDGSKQGDLLKDRGSLQDGLFEGTQSFGDLQQSILPHPTAGAPPGDGLLGDGLQGDGAQGEGLSDDPSYDGVQGDGLPGDSFQDEGLSDDPSGVDLQGDGLQGDGLQGDGLQGDGLQGDGLQGDGLRDDGLPSDGLPGDGHQGDGLRDDGLPGDGLPGDGLPGDGLPGDGLPGDGLQCDGLPGDGLPGDGLPGDGLPGDGLPGSGDELSDDGLSGDGLLGNDLQGDGLLGNDLQGDDLPGDASQKYSSADLAAGDDDAQGQGCLGEEGPSNGYSSGALVKSSCGIGDVKVRGGAKDEGGVVKDEGVVKNEGGGAKEEGGLVMDGGVVKNEGGVVKDEGGVVKDEGGGVKNEGGGAKDEGGVVKDEGGVVKNEGGVVKNEGGVVKNEGGVVKNEGGVVKYVGGGAKDEGGGSVDMMGGSVGPRAKGECGMKETSQATDVSVDKATATDDFAEYLAFTDTPLTLEDIVQGKALSLESRPVTSNRPSRPPGLPPTYLTSLTAPPSRSDPAHSHPTIHHFCTQPPHPQLPAALQVLSRRTHTVPASEACQWVTMATDRIPSTAVRVATGDGIEGATLSGVGTEIAKDPERLLWTPAAPKLALHPDVIRTHLFPRYHGSSLTVQPRPLTEELATPQDLVRHTSYLSKSVPEFSRLKDLIAMSDDVTLPTPPPPPHLGQSGDIRDHQHVQGHQVPSPPHLIVAMEQEGSSHMPGISPVRSSTPMNNVIRSAQSVPSLVPGTPTSVPTDDFQSTMKEVELQREQLASYHKQKLEVEKSHSREEVFSDESLGYDECTLSGSKAVTRLQRQALKGSRRRGGGSIGRVQVIRRTKSAQMRAQQARELLSLPSRGLRRSGSFPLYTGELAKVVIEQHSSDYRRSRRLSEPLIKDITALMVAKGASKDSSYKDWCYHVWWDEWFPEVLKECREAIAALNSNKHGYTMRSTTREVTSKEVPRPATRPKEEVQQLELDNLTPLPSSQQTLITYYEKEVENLSRLVEGTGDQSMLATHLCRRGAILRKLGKLKDAKSDLDRAIGFEPSLSDAYWHRHLLHLLQANHQAALEDLAALLRLNKKHYGALRSRAALLHKAGDVQGSIFTYSQAISANPSIAETYFARAEVYEKMGKVELALSDYAMVSKLEPSNREAILRQALHKFKQELWGASTQYFTQLLRMDPNDTMARIHRSKAQYNLGRYTEALQDLSAAIHLEPAGAQAFYQRACLLRSMFPKHALRDYSTSLLLDDSITNVHTYMNRGNLYAQMKCYDQAMCDFVSVIQLDPTLAEAHINCGLVYLLHKRNTPRAIQCFSQALAVQPTSVVALLCRAEAYKREEKYSRARLDYIRALHLEPSNANCFLYMGEIDLKEKKYEAAALQIRVVAKLNSTFEQYKMQGALVEAFIGNYEKAISLLQGLPKNSEVCSMMAKVQHKAGQYREATDNFLTALGEHPAMEEEKRLFYCQGLRKEDMATLHLLCAENYLASGDVKRAIEQFTQVLECDPRNDMAYYRRGWAKLKLDNSKGILDINKALAINPSLFQAYLTRAAYFGKSGRFSKGILNCNEALRIMPSSLRGYLYRGSLKLHTRAYRSAIEDFTAAIQLDPRHASLALFNRGLCYHTSGDTWKALADYSAVILMQPSPDFKVLVNRGLLYVELKDYANGLLDLMEAGKKAHSDPAIFQAIGLCYHHLGQLDSSIAAYSEALLLDPTFLDALVGRGNAYMDYLTEDGNEKARCDYSLALDVDSSHLPAKVNLAFLLQAQGRFKQAWDLLTSALATNKEYIPALEARSVVSLQMDNLFGALLDIDQAIQISPSAELLTNRGVIHQFMGHLVNAMSDYQQAILMDPSFVLAHFNAGNMYFHQRQFAQAITCYSKALEHSEDDSCLLNRGITHVLLGETEKALEDLNRSIQLNPYVAHAYFNRANLHRCTGHLELAEKDYRQALALFPEDWVSTYLHGDVLGWLQRKDEALEQFKRAAQLEHAV